MTTMTGDRRGSYLPARLAGIDVVRAAAALMVMISHVVEAVTVWQATFRSHVSLTIVAAIAEVTRVLGAWGVGLFFVLSGLCIHLPSARIQSAGKWTPLNLKTYFHRRLTRIYPPHLVVLVLSALVAAVLPPFLFGEHPFLTVPTWGQFVAHLFMVHTLVRGATYSVNGVLWTIALEMHFYVLYPFIHAWRRRVSMEKMCVALLCVSIMARVASKGLNADDLRLMVSQSVLCRFWEWVLGCVVAERLVAVRVMTWAGRRAVAAAMAATIVFGIAMPHVPLIGGIAQTTLWPVLFAGVIWLGARQQMIRGSPVDWVLVSVGRESYSLYLTHPITISVAAALIGFRLGPALEIPIIIISALACSAVYYRAVERVFLRRAAAVGRAVASLAGS